MLAIMDMDKQMLMVMQKRMLLKVVVAQVVVKMVEVVVAEVVDLDMVRGVLTNPLLDVSLSSQAKPRISSFNLMFEYLYVLILLLQFHVLDLK